MLVLDDEIDDKRIARQREEEYWNVEAEENNGGRMMDGAHLAHVVLDESESRVWTEADDARVVIVVVVRVVVRVVVMMVVAGEVVEVVVVVAD